MTRSADLELERLVLLIQEVWQGAFAVALHDQMSVRRKLTAALRQRLPQPVYEIGLNEHERNPVDTIQKLEIRRGSVVSLFDFERASPEVFRYLDLQREILVEAEISLVCWVTPYEHRELAGRAPNFYAFRTALFDFTAAEKLEAPTRRFIGREREIAELSSLLENGGPIVLSGLAGVGKTAVAQHIVQSMHFAGGAVWVDCEIYPDLADIVLAAAVDLLGEWARELPSDERIKRVGDALSERPCLLVLDTFEAASEDIELLRWIRSIRVPSSALVVSRVSVPYLGGTYTLSQLSRSMSVSLFSERAKDAGWDGESPETIPKLCALVGDLPLAIELLAPRAAELPLGELQKLVRQSVAVISAESTSGLSERHQSLTASFRLSFARLTENARILLRRVSPLPDGIGGDLVGPFTGVEDWQSAVSESVRHSLLALDRQRYRFHPLVRRYTLDELVRTEPEWQSRFVQFFVQFAHTNADVNDPKKLSALDREWRNAIAAAETTEALSDHRSAIDLALCLSEFLLRRGMWSDCERLMYRALTAARALLDGSAEGRILNGLSNVYRNQGRWAEAEASLQQSLTVLRDAGDTASEAVTLDTLGNVYRSQGRWQQAEAALQQSVATSLIVGDRQGEAQALADLSDVYRARGRWPEAESACRRSLTIARDGGDQYRQGRSLRNLGNIYRAQGQWTKAIENYRNSLNIARSVGDRVGESRTIRSCGNVYIKLREWEHAREALESSLTIARQIGDRVGEARTLRHYGNLYRAQGSIEKAEEMFERCVSIEREMVDRVGEARALRQWADLYREARRPEHARTKYEESLAITRDLKDRLGEAILLAHLAGVYRAESAWQKAEEALRRSLVIFEEFGDLLGTGQVLKDLAEVAAAQSRNEEAEHLIERAIDTLKRTEDRTSLDQALALSEKIKDASHDSARKNSTS